MDHSAVHLEVVCACTKQKWGCFGQIYEGFTPGAMRVVKWSECEQWKCSSEIQNQILAEPCWGHRDAVAKGRNV